MKAFRPAIIIASVTGLLFGLLSLSSDDSHSNLADNQYLVITVQGKIVFEQTGSEMKRGDTYLKGSPLNFITKTARAAIANKKDGRFIITGNKKGKVSMLPAANPISSRSGSLLNIVDLKNLFEGRLCILDQLRLKIGDEGFPQGEDAYFYVTYDYNGEIIPKKLGHDGEFLIIDKNELFKVDGKAIPVEEKEMTFYYKGVDKLYKISKFTPVFPDMEVLKEETILLLKAGDYVTDRDRIDHLSSFIEDFYGKPDIENLRVWLKKEFK